MKRIIAIGGTYAETAEFARQIDVGNIWHVVSRESIRGQRPDVVHLLPGYFSRRDIHSVGAEVKVMQRKNTELEVVTWVLVDGFFVDAAEDVRAEPDAPQDATQRDPIGADGDIVNVEPPVVTPDFDWLQSSLDFDAVTLGPEPVEPEPVAPEPVVPLPVVKRTPAKPKPAPKKKKPPVKRKSPAVVAKERAVLSQPAKPVEPVSDFFDFLDNQ